MLHQYKRGLQMFQWDFGIPLEVLQLASLTKVRRMKVQVARIVHQIRIDSVIKD